MSSSAWFFVDLEQGAGEHSISVLREATGDEAAVLRRGFTVARGDRLGAHRVLLHSIAGLLKALDEERDYQQFGSGQPQSAGLAIAVQAWAAAFRAYADTSKAWLSATLGKKGPEYISFVEALNAEFDSNAGYRVADAWRNGIQHSGIKALKFYLGRGDTAGFYLDRDEFYLGYPKVRGKTRAELRSGPGALDLRKIVQASGCLYPEAVLWDAIRPLVMREIEMADAVHSLLPGAPDRLGFAKFDLRSRDLDGLLHLNSFPFNLTEWAARVLETLDDVLIPGPSVMALRDLETRTGRSTL